MDEFSGRDVIGQRKGTGRSQFFGFKGKWDAVGPKAGPAGNESKVSETGCTIGDSDFSFRRKANGIPEDFRRSIFLKPF